MHTIISYHTLRAILERLGFSFREASQQNAVVFENKEHGSVIWLPHYEEMEPVWEANLVSIRRHLDEEGVIPAERFDQLIASSERDTVRAA